MSTLLRRVGALEKRNRISLHGSRARITLRYANLDILPPSYKGERHERLIRGLPSEEPGGDCLIQEYPGPGPELDFGFAPGTLLVQFVAADGEGHPRPYGPVQAIEGQ